MIEICRDGGMVDALGLGPSGILYRGGSSPLPGINVNELLIILNCLESPDSSFFYNYVQIMTSKMFQS